LRTRSQSLPTLKESFASGKVIEVNDRYELCYIALQTRLAGSNAGSKAVASSGSKPEFVVCPQYKRGPQTGMTGSWRLNFIEPRWLCHSRYGGVCQGLRSSQNRRAGISVRFNGSCGGFRGAVPCGSSVAKPKLQLRITAACLPCAAEGKQCLRDVSVQQGAGYAGEPVTG
jgi:hypothetical protein